MVAERLRAAGDVVRDREHETGGSEHRQRPGSRPHAASPGERPQALERARQHDEPGERRPQLGADRREARERERPYEQRVPARDRRARAAGDRDAARPRRRCGELPSVTGCHSLMKRRKSAFATVWRMYAGSSSANGVARHAAHAPSRGRAARATSARLRTGASQTHDAAYSTQTPAPTSTAACRFAQTTSSGSASSTRRSRRPSSRPSRHASRPKQSTENDCVRTKTSSPTLAIATTSTSSADQTGPPPRRSAARTHSPRPAVSSATCSETSPAGPAARQTRVEDDVRAPLLVGPAAAAVARPGVVAREAVLQQLATGRDAEPGVGRDRERADREERRRDEQQHEPGKSRHQPAPRARRGAASAPGDGWPAARPRRAARRSVAASRWPSS